jgi:hypothetical protein
VEPVSVAVEPAASWTRIVLGPLAQDVYAVPGLVQPVQLPMQSLHLDVQGRQGRLQLFHNGLHQGDLSLQRRDLPLHGGDLGVVGSLFLGNLDLIRSDLLLQRGQLILQGRCLRGV